MIPSMIALGVVLGAVTGWRALPPVRAIGSALVVSVGFGVAVSSVIAGTALALVNAAIGMLAGWSVQRLAAGRLR